MGNRWQSAILLVLCCALVLRAAQHEHDSSGHTMDKPTAGPAWSELTSGMDKMHLAMASIEPSGNADLDFVRLMLPHHQAAVDMAKTQLQYGKDPQMRRLAQEIITGQQSEIELMQLWLKQNAPDSPQVVQTPAGLPSRKD